MKPEPLVRVFLCFILKIQKKCSKSTQPFIWFTIYKLSKLKFPDFIRLTYEHLFYRISNFNYREYRITLSWLFSS